MTAPTYKGSAGASGTLGADPTVDLSGVGLADKDFMIAFARGGGAVAKPDASWTTSPASLGANQPLFWKKWSTGDATSYTFVTTGAVNSVVGIAVYSGVHTTSPVDDSDGVTGTGAMVVPSVDSAGTNRTLVGVACKLQNTTFTFSGTMGSNEHFDTTVATQSFVIAGADEAIGLASSGTRTMTPASGAANGVAYLIVLRNAITDYTQSADLVGDGVVSRVVEVAESKNLVGDGVLTRTVDEGTIRSLTGDGVVTRQLGVGLSRDLVGDGVLDGSKAVVAAKTTDLVGDGVITRQLGETTSRDLSGDGVVTSQMGATIPRNLVGDGVVTRSLAVTVNRDLTGAGTITGNPGTGISTDLLGDGTVTSAKAVTAGKTFNLVGDGTITESHGGNFNRLFDLTGDGVISGSADIPFPIIPECAPDWSPNDGLKAIAGTVLFHEPPNQGDPVSGATVCLFRDSDGVRIECTTTAPDGTYSFPRDTNDPYTYHVEVNYDSGGVKQQGLSEGGCVPV